MCLTLGRKVNVPGKDVVSSHCQNRLKDRKCRKVSFRWIVCIFASERPHTYKIYEGLTLSFLQATLEGQDNATTRSLFVFNKKRYNLCL